MTYFLVYRKFKTQNRQVLNNKYLKKCSSLQYYYVYTKCHSSFEIYTLIQVLQMMSFIYLITDIGLTIET